MSSITSTNTSKAFWELKAEQVMDRVFHQASPRGSTDEAQLQDAIEVDVHEALPPPGSGPHPTPRFQNLQSKQWLFVALLLCILGASLGLWQGWNMTQRQLRLERNARLLSDLRNLPSREEPAQTTKTESPPPPPVEEAWMAQLPPLPAIPTTLEDTSTTIQPELPALVGVVQIPGQRGSAIFQQGTSSSNALVGEQIGSSGWRLVAIQSDGAVIERNGMRRRVSIGAGL